MARRGAFDLLKSIVDADLQSDDGSENGDISEDENNNQCDLDDFVVL